MPDLFDQMNSFDTATRRRALADAMRSQPAFPSAQPAVNMHMHSFFSFNGEGHSPTRLAWEAAKQGLYAAGICDFDVLAGLDEFLDAGDVLGLRTAVGFESRTFFAEYGDQEINSPGEPGVFYFMGAGFVQEPNPNSTAGAVFSNMLERAHQRNRDLIARIDAKLDGLALDYEQDVLPLTPRGNATERHIIDAYYRKALDASGGRADAAAAFWARVLGEDESTLRALAADTNAFRELLRGKLMKRGGLGYEQPTDATFPRLDDVIAMILACKAIPMSTWLDGTSQGEADPESQLECLIAKGIAAVNIVPDRNWNLSDPAVQERKVRELHRYARTAAALGLPINVGTELNKPGQRFVDDFGATPMRPLHDLFMEGARTIVGHTRLLRYADFSYTGEAAANTYPVRTERNRFFAAVGALPAPRQAIRGQLTDADAERAFAMLADAATRGRW